MDHPLRRLDADGLRSLASIPGVVAIGLDVREEMHLDSALPIINIDDAHARGTAEGYGGLTGEGWTIVILDTGIQANHPFFGGRVVAEACFSTEFPSTPPSGFGSQSLCPNGKETQFGPGAASPSVCGFLSVKCHHGTHVAGIAAGRNGSLSGAAPGANIIMLNVFSQSRAPITNDPIVGDIGTFVSDQIAALEYVKNTLSGTYKIAAINMSLGGSAFNAACDSDADPTQQARIDVINLLTDMGIGVVVSAGNEGSKTHITRPACVSSALAVSAITDIGAVASFSNANMLVDFFAPGDDIMSAGLEGTFFTQSGTSMAAPFVAGALAVMKQAAPNASLTEITNALRTTGLPVFDTRPGGTAINIPLIKVDKAIDVLRGDADYLYNGDFETQGINKKTPDGWTRTGGAKRKCNNDKKTFTIYGSCAAVVKADANGNGGLTQKVDSPRGLRDDVLTLQAQAMTKNLTGGKVQMVVKLVTNVKQKVNIKLSGTEAWTVTPLSNSLTLNDTVKNINVKVKVSAGGKYHLDDVKVLLDKIEVEVP